MSWYNHIMDQEIHKNKHLEFSCQKWQQSELNHKALNDYFKEITVELDSIKDTIPSEVINETKINANRIRICTDVVARVKLAKGRRTSFTQSS